MKPTTKASVPHIHPAPPTPEQIEAMKAPAPAPAPLTGIEAEPPVDGAAPPADVQPADLDQAPPAKRTNAR
jgi:hypothetical protein